MPTGTARNFLLVFLGAGECNPYIILLTSSKTCGLDFGAK